VDLLDAHCAIIALLECIQSLWSFLSENLIVILVEG
jgi:hypothetical protein